ncbi:MAG: hypothetical protein JW702_11030 [Clostridiales bacterium]|nr:hypothetical protein [Clostridiales bacterium]
MDEYGLSWLQFLALDSNDTPHLIYQGYADGDWLSPATMMHASWKGSGWSIENTNLGGIRDMALDSNDKPHVLLIFSSAIRYASKNFTGWETQEVGDGTVGSLALDSNDNPHIVHNQRIGELLKYASLTPSGWQTQSIPGSHNSNNQLFLELDSNDNPHILYGSKILGPEDTEIPAIKYAYNKGSGWNITTVISHEGIGETRNLALDSKGHPHFMYVLTSINPDYGYYTAKNSSLIYVSWNGSAWNSQTVATNLNWDVQTIYFALDSQDCPHVVFYNQTTSIPSGVLTYSTWTGTEWASQVVDPTDALTAGAIAVDSNGTPHISYLGRLHWPTRNHADIKYATPTEVTPPVDSSPLPSTLDLFTIASLLVIVSSIAVIIVYFWKKH